MRRLALAAAIAAPTLLGAQSVSIVERGQGRAAAIVDSVLAGPHVLRTGTGSLVFPRDSTITTSLVVLGRDTFLASRVTGDVVVVGADLFLRPGSEITGRAVAIGGTVAETTLGTVGRGSESLRDESFRIEETSRGTYALSAYTDRVGGDSAGIVQLSGIRGVKLPRYDRVNGLSLPVGLSLTLGQVRVEPSATYRSRLGVIDPEVAVRVGAEEGTRFEGRAARDTRSNDLWITSELINSLKTLAFGTDTRNYFRSDIGEGRLYLSRGSERALVEPFIGGRFERVWPVTATGTAFSFTGRRDSLKLARPNPLVEAGHLASALAGIVYETKPGEDAGISSRLALEAERSFTTPAGTGNFTQLSADGRIDLPAIRNHRLLVRAHAVGTMGDSVPRARYAYLGGSRTLSLTDLLALGGDQLVFVESRYLIPIEGVVLPVVGSPMIGLTHRVGGAGVGSIGSLQQEVGAALTLGPVVLDVVFAASGQAKKWEPGIGVVLPAF